MPRKRTSRVYLKRGRYYGDFRDYADVGGGREALKPAPRTPATTDPDVANDLATARVRQLEQLRRKKQLTGVARESSLAAFAAYHLEQKKLAGKVEDSTLEASQLHLESALAFFGDREIGAVSVSDVQDWTRQLMRKPNRRGGTLSATAARKYLNSLSNLYRRAAAEGYVLPGFNPVAAMMDKPSGVTRQEAEWLEPHEVALFLEAARHYEPRKMVRSLRHLRSVPAVQAHALVAAFALTGGREAEVLGLGSEDVSFDRGTIAFRPNHWRRLKTRTSWRAIPLWPQLREILQAYVFSGDAPRGPLLFPSARLGPDEMIVDVRALLDAIAALCGWKPGEIRTKMFRHSYCAQRLQTADRVLRPGRAPGDPDAFDWIPVSPYTVGKEMGHGGDSLVRRVYGHLGQVRHRSEVVEFRTEYFREQLAERLAALHVRSAQQAPARCTATGWNGERCKVVGNLSPAGLCLWHDPERREQARAARPHSRDSEAV